MNYQDKKNFSATEVMMVIEDLQSQFRVFGDGLMGLNEKSDSLSYKFDSLNYKFDGLSYKVDGITEQVSQNSVDITLIKDDISEIKEDVQRIDKKLDHKVDRDELKGLLHNYV